jgi:FkbM family methyltransferase
MYLDNLVPSRAAALFSPACLIRKVAHPDMVSFGLMANLASARRRGLIDGIDAIVDVGANTGQFAFMAHSVWPDVPVYSFEPDPASHARLRRNFERFRIPGSCFELALGARVERRDLRVQSNSEQSSFLGRIDAGTGCEQEVEVRCDTLDRVATGFDPAPRRALLKVDTQGFELQVLDGAGAFLDRVAYVQLEVAFRPAYHDQPAAAEIIAAMAARGFSCLEILDILRDPAATGRPVAEADLLFARAGHRARP